MVFWLVVQSMGALNDATFIDVGLTYHACSLVFYPCVCMAVGLQRPGMWGPP